jgi:gluconate 2-dehydrogenase gamma chain
MPQHLQPEQIPEENQSASVTRRELIGGVALAGAALATGALIPISEIQAAPQASAAVAKSAPAFLPEQRRILEALIDRIIPRDENGPGALDAGAADYIDRAFVEFIAAEKDSFVQGLVAVDAFARTSQGSPFADLSPEKRDAVLTAIDNGEANQLRAVFARARRLTLEGMFCDPHWGGNKNFVGWDLIKYPGVRLLVTPDDQRMSAPAAPVHRSAYDAGDQSHGENHGH